MRVLAFDTSSPRASAAFVDGSAVRAHRQQEVKRHGSALQPLLRDVLEDAGVTLADLELIAVGVGPGSFTGTRIGLAEAKGLAFGRGLPLVGIGSLEVLAAAVEGDDLRAPVVDAGKGRVYGALYARSDGRMVLRGEPFDHAPEAALEALRDLACGEPFRLVGSGLARHESLRVHAHGGVGSETPDARVLARLALDQAARGAVSGPALEPLYVRPCDAKLPARPQATTDS